jgi:hypothetical protein
MLFSGSVKSPGSPSKGLQVLYLVLVLASLAEKSEKDALRVFSVFSPSFIRVSASVGSRDVYDATAD